MAKISVIVPVYKVEKFLPLCLKSLSDQTLTDFEVICVDDGSPDNCGKILDEHAARDGRFKVIHQQNGGLSVARNAGYPYISAPYTMFVDSDDALHPQALELALEAIQNHHADVVWFDVANFGDGEDLSHLPTYASLPETIPCLDQPLRSYAAKPLWRRHRNERIQGIVWNKIYRSDLVKEILFEPTLSPGEDNLFTIEVMANAKTVVHLKAPLYCYRFNPSSIMHTVNIEKLAKNLPIEMSGYVKLQKRIDTGDFSDEKKRIIRKYIVAFFFRKFFRPLMKKKNTWVQKDYVDNFIHNSELDFSLLNLRYRLPVLLYKKGFIKLARLLTV